MFPYIVYLLLQSPIRPKYQPQPSEEYSALDSAKVAPVSPFLSTYSLIKSYLFYLLRHFSRQMNNTKIHESLKDNRTNVKAMNAHGGNYKYRCVLKFAALLRTELSLRSSRTDYNCFFFLLSVHCKLRQRICSNTNGIC